jgi:hypothetical protein
MAIIVEMGHGDEDGWRSLVRTSAHTAKPATPAASTPSKEHD